jgi:hypothetical protein
MPNFKLGSTIKDELKDCARKLAARRVDVMTSTFPLTVAQIQEAIMPAEPLKAIRWLNSENVVGVSSTNRIHIRLSPEYLPGLPRYCVAQLHLPEGVYPSKHSSFWGSNGSTYEPDKHFNDLTLNEGTLDDEARDAVTEWATKAIKERRLQNMANVTVTRAIDRIHSTGDVQANWAFIGTLLPDKNSRWNGDGNLDMWRKRFQNGPRSLKRYERPESTESKKLKDAVEIFLNSAMMLSDYKHTGGTVRSELVAWEKLSSDRF